MHCPSLSVFKLSPSYLALHLFLFMFEYFCPRPQFALHRSVIIIACEDVYAFCFQRINQNLFAIPGSKSSIVGLHLTDVL